MRSGKVFDVGIPIKTVPAPLGGATFGMGVLSTPTAEVGGEIQNPFASEDLGTLLGGNRARMLLQQAGLDRAGEFEWLAGPEEATAERVAETLGNEGTQVPKTWPEFDSLSVLGADAEVKSFAGVIGGGEGPTAVGIHVARVRSDGNTVIAAGVHRTPAGSAKSTGYPVPRPDYYPDARPDSYPVPRPDYFRSRALAGETAGRVVYADEPE